MLIFHQVAGKVLQVHTAAILQNNVQVVAAKVAAVS
jgi:hypothetical protein